MQLTKQTDFAFRTLMYLAALPTGERAQIHTICDVFAVSPNHLSKVVNKLGQAGYIETRRGRSGGICLARNAASINLREVIETMEPNLAPVNCHTPRCALLPACRLKSALEDAVTAFLDTLHQYSLADMMDKELSILLFE